MQLQMLPESEHEKMTRLAGEMEGALNGRGWVTSDQLCAELELPVTEAGRRLLREAVNFSAGKIASAPGTPGYALTRQLTPQQIGIIDSLKTQAVAMLRRRNAILRCWHQHKAA